MSSWEEISNSRGKSMLIAAAWHAACDLHVFPCSYGSARPLVSVSEATTDPRIIGHWWKHQFAGSNIGVACGSGSGLIVLSTICHFRINRKGNIEPVNGLKNLEKVLSITGKKLSAHQTYTVCRAEGGYDYYFKLPDGANVVSNHKAFSGILNGNDTNITLHGEGSYVLAAPSAIENVLTSRGLLETRFYSEFGTTDRIAECPEWILQRA